ncbi:MAG: hypothetical protein ACKOEM_08155 [Planctomycetia bacterium]
MGRILQKLQKPVWLVVAAVALVAQVVPQAWSGDCDRGCCAAEVHECCTACPADTADPPCHCQLDARQDQPVSVLRGTSPQPDLLDQVAVADWAFTQAPHALGVSREYVAASLAVPIRPTRILYGVWRN